MGTRAEVIPVFVDKRRGSDELAAPLSKLGFAVELTTLEYGDVAFQGQGVKHQPVQIAVEFKKLADLAQSLKDGRLTGHQIPGLVREYDYRWLLLEGQYQTDKQGRVSTVHISRRFRRPQWGPLEPVMLTSQMERRLLTIEQCNGVYVRHTNTRRDSLVWLSNLIHWWTDKALDEHQSHLHDHQPLGFLTISDFRAAVQKWPGVSLATSLAAEQVFGTVRKAATATVDEWASVTTVNKGKARRFGLRKAERLVAWLGGQ